MVFGSRYCCYYSIPLLLFFGLLSCSFTPNMRWWHKIIRYLPLLYCNEAQGNPTSKTIKCVKVPMTLIHNFHSSLTALHPCDDPNPCDQVNGICQTVDSQSQCSCKRGYELGADNSTCDDINECSTGVAACTQLCNNTEGGYNCSCNDGYKLADNGFDCTGRWNICRLISEATYPLDIHSLFISQLASIFPV